MNEKKTKVNDSIATKLPWIIFSLVCALLLWVYVTDTEGDEVTLDYPGVKVVFEGESALRDNKGLVISDTETNSVKVSLTGSRRTLSAIDSADLSVVIDLNGITKTGTYSLAPKVIYPSRVDNNTITHAATNPGNIGFYVDKISKKSVDVEGVFNGSPAEGFSADPMEFSPSTVIVSGPEKMLSQIDHAYVEIDREDVDKTLSFDSTFTLIDVDGNPFVNENVTCDTDTVGVTLPINAVKEVNLTLSFTEGGGATEKNVAWTLEPSSIILSGDSETLAGVNNITVAKIDLSKVDEVLTERCKIVIPNDTVNMSGEREAVLTLSIEGLYKRNFTIPKNNISCINVSEGFEAEIMNSFLEGVVIRGHEQVVKSISDVNIRAVADLTDYGTATGIISVPVRVSIDGTTGAGAVGEYKVYINITKAES